MSKAEEAGFTGRKRLEKKAEFKKTKDWSFQLLSLKGERYSVSGDLNCVGIRHEEFTITSNETG